jgi:hypothetical protein
MENILNLDAFAKTPSTALCCIFRYSDVMQVRLPQDLHALYLGLFQKRRKLRFLRIHQSYGKNDPSHTSSPGFFDTPAK